MAKTDAERARDYRRRVREKREADRSADGRSAVITVAEHEEKLARYRARVEQWRDQQAERVRVLEAEVARLTAELEAAQHERQHGRGPERASKRPDGNPAPSRRQRPGKPQAASTASAGDHSGHLLNMPRGSSRNGRYYCETCKTWFAGPVAG